MDRPTERRLRAILREANWSDVTAESLAEHGVVAEDRARVLKETAEVRRRYAAGDFSGAMDHMEDALGQLEDVTIGERPATAENDPRELAKQALGERSEADADDSPRKLAEGIEVY